LVTHTERDRDHGTTFGVGQQTGEYGAPHDQDSKITRDDILAKWGKPKRKYTENDREYWAYNHSLAWRGAVVWIIVPIPLLVPAGFNETVVEFDGNNATRWWNERGAGGKFECAPNAGPGAIYQCR